jgi:hypothetical protein
MFMCNENLSNMMFSVRFKRPLALHGVTVPLLYHSTKKKAWMTGELFSSILVDFDKRSTENRALLVDNAGSHTIPAAQAKAQCDQSRCTSSKYHCPPSTE